MRKIQYLIPLVLLLPIFALANSVYNPDLSTLHYKCSNNILIDSVKKEYIVRNGNDLSFHPCKLSKCKYTLTDNKVTLQSSRGLIKYKIPVVYYPNEDQINIINAKVTMGNEYCKSIYLAFKDKNHK